MKKVSVIAMTIILGVALLGCSNSDQAQNHEQLGMNPTSKKEDVEQKFIIRNSVNDPLPPEAKNIHAMPSKKEPQQIPNANLHAPIVITKMPYSEKNRP